MLLDTTRFKPKPPKSVPPFKIDVRPLHNAQDEVAANEARLQELQESVRFARGRADSRKPNPFAIKLAENAGDQAELASMGAPSEPPQREFTPFQPTPSIPYPELAIPERGRPEINPIASAVTGLASLFAPQGASRFTSSLMGGTIHKANQQYQERIQQRQLQLHDLERKHRQQVDDREEMNRVLIENLRGKELVDAQNALGRHNYQEALRKMISGGARTAAIESVLGKYAEEHKAFSEAESAAKVSEQELEDFREDLKSKRALEATKALRENTQEQIWRRHLDTQKFRKENPELFAFPSGAVPRTPLGQPVYQANKDIADAARRTAEKAAQAKVSERKETIASWTTDYKEAQRAYNEAEDALAAHEKTTKGPKARLLVKGEEGDALRARTLQLLTERDLKLKRLQGVKSLDPRKKVSAGPVTITSKAQFDKLPSGTLFIAPDGSTRRKP